MCLFSFNILLFIHQKKKFKFKPYLIITILRLKFKFVVTNYDFKINIMNLLY